MASGQKTWTILPANFFISHQLVLNCSKNYLQFCFRSCTLVEDVLIGANTKISDNTVVCKSVIGKNCVIGSNVTITGSYIMNNVVIKDNCKIINSFVDDNCTVEKDSDLENGTILTSNATMAPGSKLKGSVVEGQGDTNGKYGHVVTSDISII